MDFDTLFVSCTNFRALEAVPLLEEAFGCTVLTSNSAIIEAIKAEIVQTGRFTSPEFGGVSVRETPKRTAMNPRTGEKVAVKAGATVRFKPSPALREAAHATLKKSKRKAANGG